MPSMQMRISFEFLSDSDPETVFDSVADALFDQEASSTQLQDADVTANLEEAKISLSIVGNGINLEEASATASGAIKTALRNSGATVPDWDQNVRAVQNQSVFRFLEQTLIPA